MHNLVDLVLEINRERRAALKQEISKIVDDECLDPGQAGKLKGKLLFWIEPTLGRDRESLLEIPLRETILEDEEK